MLTKRSKGLYIEVTENAFMVATTSQLDPPFVIEDLKEFPRKNPEELRAYTESLSGVKGVKYIRAHCGVMPESRFFRRHTIESMAKAKDPNYFADLFNSTLKIDPETNTAAIISHSTGEPFSVDQPLSSQKELVICGASEADFSSLQSELLECGVYPESLQLAGLSSLAGLKNYLSWSGFEDTILSIEVSSSVSNLFILSAEKVDLCRTIPFGFDSMYPAVQKELGLKDEASAMKLFQSSTFDFTELGSSLLKKVMKEVQASTGFYEVQTGQSIPYFYAPHLPLNLQWIPDVIKKDVGLDGLDISFKEWLDDEDITIGDSVDRSYFNSTWFGIISLMVKGSRETDGKN